MTVTVRIPPHNIDVEQATLGAMLLNSDAVPAVLETVQAPDFYREDHRLIFQAIQALFERSMPADFQTVAQTLQSWGKLDVAGGVERLTGLVEAIPSAANVQHYADIVRNYSTLRQLIVITADICGEAYNGLPEDMGGFLDSAEQRVFSVCEQRSENRAVHVASLMQASFQKIEALYERKEHITGVPSGFHDLDKLTAGFQPSDLIIIAGRPSMGKTSFGLAAALYGALDARIPCAVFSLEMSKEQLALRLLCSKARVNLQALRTGYLNQTDWGRLATAIGVISDAPLLIDDTAQLTALELRARARRLKREYNLGLIVIDYLQLMRGHARGDSREREISEISRSLKALAKELDVPVIALSQLNRKVEDRPDKRPHLSDLRESGAIEQDADVILFIYRDEVYNDSPDNPKRGIAEIIIGKQRNGPIGKIELQFEHAISTFRPLARVLDAQMESL